MSDVVVLEPVQGVMLAGELTEKEVVKRRQAIQKSLEVSKKYLLELKDNDNWKKDPIVKQNNIQTMEQYWNVAFGYTKQHGYRLIQEQEVRESIEDESLQPENEGQARVLATIPAPFREKVMAKAYEIAPEPANKKLPKKVSAKVVEQAKAIIQAQYPDDFPKPIETAITPPVSTKVDTNGSNAISERPASEDPRDYTMSDEEYKVTPRIMDILLVKSRKDLVAIKFRYSDGTTAYEYYRNSIKGLAQPKVDTNVPNSMTKAESFVKDAEMTLSDSDFAADKTADAAIFDKEGDLPIVPPGSDLESDPLAE